MTVKKMPTASTSDPIIVRVLKSVFFRNATGKAGKYARNTGSLLQLLRNVLGKTNALKGENFDSFRAKITLLTRFLKAYIKGEYKVVPWKTLTSIISVLIYFLSPIDVLPDFLPVIGLTDDIALVVWLFNAISDDLEAFRAWDAKQNTISID
ncbi:MAG: YkvA family protein [Spirosomataceae bacterium]